MYMYACTLNEQFNLMMMVTVVVVVIVVATTTATTVALIVEVVAVDLHLRIVFCEGTFAVLAKVPNTTLYQFSTTVSEINL